MGIISKEYYEEVLEKAYIGIEKSLYFDDDGYLVIDNICIGTAIGPGTYEYYVSRKKMKNDLHGVGAFVLIRLGNGRILKE